MGARGGQKALHAEETTEAKTRGGTRNSSQLTLGGSVGCPKLEEQKFRKAGSRSHKPSNVRLRNLKFLQEAVGATDDF